MPSDNPDLLTLNGISNLPNITATIHLTKKLEKLAHVILRLRRCPRSHQVTHLLRLKGLRAEFSSWWESLPTVIHCRDLSPTGPLFRCNVHLELSYATGTIYMGRPFIFIQKEPLGSSEANSEGGIRAELVQTFSADCAQAAIRIIDLCQLLQDSVGLARVSYTEFSSCRAALLALIAQRLTKTSDKICNALSRGMVLICQMCVGLESARSEVAVIEALERARLQLDHQSEQELTEMPSGSGYNQFLQWAKLWRFGPADSDAPPTTEEVETPANPGDVPLFDGFFSSFPQELNAFAAIPGSENDAIPPSIWPGLPDMLFPMPENDDPLWDVGGSM